MFEEELVASEGYHSDESNLQRLSSRCDTGQEAATRVVDSLGFCSQDDMRHTNRFPAGEIVKFEYL